MNLAEDIDDILIPDALEYYLGLGDDFEQLDGLEGDDDDSDHEDGDGSGDDSDGADKKGKKKGGKADKGGAKPGAEGQQECKQQ